MEDEARKQEYVMADDGLIWRGSYNRLRPTVWKYSQFERDILDCALHLVINVGKVRISGRNDPVVVSRVLSAAVSMKYYFDNFECLRTGTNIAGRRDDWPSFVERTKAIREFAR